MYKRRDWIFTHNPDTGAISSESGSDSEDDARSEASGSDSEYASGIDSDGISEEEEEEPMHSMEALQGMLEGSDEEEADEPSGQEETLTVARNGTEAGGSGTPVDSESIEDQKMAWLQAEGPDKPKGVPLRCLLCKNKLLVSCDVFRQHLTSKMHLANAKRHGILDDQLKQLDHIVAASSVRVLALEGAETHAQRIERFQQIKDSLDKKATKQKRTSNSQDKSTKPTGAKRCKHTVEREGEKTVQQRNDIKGKNSSDKKDKSAGKKKKGKPGKRQREALKAAKAAECTNAAAVASHTEA